MTRDLTAAGTLQFIDRSYIAKIRKLSRTVSAYAQNKDASIAAELEQKGTDELSSLMGQTADMILEMDNYMKSLVKTTEELSHTKARVDIEAEIARKDALTGIRNRIAYEEELTRLERRFAEGETKFGFAVVDLNCLKKINDTYGHEFGNIAIKECCDLVCRIFAHSPVFRIGGDEFVVILENADYRHVEELTAAFSREQEKNQKAGEGWKCISAAIGYALYEKEKDDSVESVFNRADQEMYRRKHEMKAL